MNRKATNLVVLLMMSAFIFSACKKDDDEENAGTTVVYTPTTNLDKISSRTWDLTSLVQGGTELIDSVEIIPACVVDDGHKFRNTFIYEIIPGSVLCPGDTIPPDTTIIVPEPLPIYWNFADEEESIVIAGATFDLLGISSNTLRYKNSTYTYTYTAR